MELRTDFQTLRVQIQERICFVQIYRPESNNTINDQLVDEFHRLLEMCEDAVTVLVIQGLPEVFCFGADFQGLRDNAKSGDELEQDPGPLYDLWLKLASGPYIVISLVKGKVNAGGIGFVAASDIVLADHTAQFSLSEMLFGLYPACVLPFLIRRTGIQKAHYLTLMTSPILVDQAHAWGLIDAFDTSGEVLLRKHLLRLRRLTKKSVSAYKRYMISLQDNLSACKPLAVAANVEMFSDTDSMTGIIRYVEQGKFPWEE
ncbi:enoyl-CoA hydratase/isomerase [Paenibacillus sp. JNUCC31]|uniref:enoyl-CoA hydratase/isomerase n=1 Tax=Paenibacillus sp. JNUCC-31 TaxID=2777983 RepID=UPI0017811E39|nr:enoyl-CoA hydratase/isomerase [Paenibacillus sp. JNUCC-31]QOS80426.1 enoyl-CoA hydratase/isomerase [Paenibacillus sp. JNUCC-31]